MTSPETSEVEVEAAAKAMRASQMFRPPPWEEIFKSDQEYWRKSARAALTAAAQVRAQSVHAHKTMTCEEYLALNLQGWHEVCWRYDGAGGVGVRYYTDGELPVALGIRKGE